MKPGYTGASVAYAEPGEAVPLTDEQRRAEQQAAFLVPFIRDWRASVVMCGNSAAGRAAGAQKKKAYPSD